MKLRTPLCDFALRLDQVHPGIEVVVFNTYNWVPSDATELERRLMQVGTFGQFRSAPYTEGRELMVDLNGYATHYFYSTNYTNALGLNPYVQWNGWCNHMTGSDYRGGRYTANVVHNGSRCPNIHREISWSDMFVVKFKDAHRVLGCKPLETRELLMTVVRERFEQEEEDYQAYLGESLHDEY